MQSTVHRRMHKPCRHEHKPLLSITEVHMRALMRRHLTFEGSILNGSKCAVHDAGCHAFHSGQTGSAGRHTTCADHANRSTLKPSYASRPKHTYGSRWRTCTQTPKDATGKADTAIADAHQHTECTQAPHAYCANPSCIAHRANQVPH